jgi:hypothetical protein
VTQVQAFLAVGEEVAGYRIESFIGRGGMAVVYRAQDLRLGRQVALKLLAPELSENERFRQRFMRESQLAAAIDHPNIIPIYDAGNTPDLLYIVMRYVDGMDLKALLEREHRLQPDRVLHLFMQVASALDAAHARGLVHRDVKPGNIIVASGHGGEDVDHVYLTDFGLTKKSLSLSDFTTVGHFVGTVDYVAPEQIASKPIDGRADIYGLGCVMYEALAGVLPFERDDDAATLWAHMLEPVAPLTSHRPDLPPGVDAVFARALAKAPEDRYPTCRALVAALRTELAGWQAAETSVAHPAGIPSPAAPESGPQPSIPAAPDVAAEPVERQAPAEPAGPGRSKQRRARTSRFAARTLALLAALVVVVAVGGVLLWRGTRGGMATYDGRLAAAPFALQHPRSWRPDSHSGFFVVFSPTKLDELFAGSGWQQAVQALRRDPTSVKGIYARVSYQGFDINDPDLQDQVTGELGAVGGVTFTGDPQSVSVSDRPAVRLDGTLSDPSGPTRLRFQYYLVPIDPQQQSTAHLMFFATPRDFPAERPLFQRVLTTVDVTRAG